MAIPGSRQGCPHFRKFLYHEPITVTGWPHTLTDMQSVNVDRPGTGVPGDQEELGTCGSPTGPHAPPVKGPTRTSCSFRVRPRTAQSSSAGAARYVPSALRTLSTTASSLASGAG